MNAAKGDDGVQRAVGDRKLSRIPLSQCEAIREARTPGLEHAERNVNAKADLNSVGTQGQGFAATAANFESSPERSYSDCLEKGFVEVGKILLRVRIGQIVEITLANSVVMLLLLSALGSRRLGRKDGNCPARHFK